MLIVVYDDESGVCCPMTWDGDCEGAICCGSGAIALFDTRKQARKAITISKRFALLQKAQGKPEDDTFTSGAALLKIREARTA